jgi:methyl-accepting chemotaxis protein
MNIRQKMLLGAGLLTLIPVALTAALLWQNASTVAGDAVRGSLQTELEALRTEKLAEVRQELETRVQGLQTLAAQRSTADAFKAFKSALATVPKELGADESGQRAEIAKYVDAEFNKEFAVRNSDAAPSFKPILDAIDPITAALQVQFIVRNANKLGEKDKLTAAASASAYNTAHGNFHPGLERAQKLQQFYDIFLIDPETDRIVYTVYKELDFATSLNTGIAAKTKLDEVYRKAKAAPSRDFVAVSDFAPYLASYNDQAAFAASPIFEGDKLIAVIAMQIPIDRITEAMSSGRNWKGIGLGDTGDTFLVGPDFKMRSNARYMLEADKRATFLEQIKGQLGGAAGAQVNKKQTTIGLVTVKSAATEPAIAGQSGYLQFTDYRGIPVYGAYGPLRAYGLNWALVTKKDVAEAELPIDELNRSSLVRAITIGLIIVAIAGLLVSLFLSRFLKPIQKLSDTVLAVAGGDTEARSKLTEQDEIGELGRQFDGLLDERIAALQKAAAENETLNNSVIALLQTVFQLSNRDLTARAPVTEDIIGTVSSSINQFSDETAKLLGDVRGVVDRVRMTSEQVRQQALLVQETSAEEQRALADMGGTLNQTTEQLVQVASLSETSNAAAQQTATATQAALAAVQDTVQGMDGLRESISEMEKRFKRLGERSNEISTAVNLINTISERTHVLALNASMQAATAGEAGRGFAVVAEEVQRLSDSSRQATAQIAQLVGNIQAETNETLFTVNRMIGEVVKQSDSARRAGTQMTQTQAATQQLVGLVQQIAQFSSKQSDLADALRASIANINKGTQRTASAIDLQTNATQILTEYSGRLAESVAQFKLPDDAGQTA